MLRHEAAGEGCGTLGVALVRSADAAEGLQLDAGAVMPALHPRFADLAFLVRQPAELLVTLYFCHFVMFGWLLLALQKHEGGWSELVRD